MSARALEQRILNFVRDASFDNFGDLALALFEQQFKNLPGYRAYCDALGVTPAAVADWREIPPIAAGELDQPLRPEPAEPAGHSEPEEFRSTLVRATLPDLFSPDPVWLVIDAGSAAGVQTVVDILASKAPQGSFIARHQRLDAKRLRSWLGARQRERRSVQIVATAAGYRTLIELLERRGLKFRLPPGSTAFCLAPITAVAASSWNAALAEHLGVDPGACRRVICGRESSTPLLELTDDSSGSFRIPHWVRVTSSGSQRIAILDLAALDAPVRRIEAVAARVDGDSGDGDNHTLRLETQGSLA